MTDVSILIPVYNEAATISAVLERVCGLSLGKEVLVVDDGSRDETGSILKGLAGRLSFKLISHAVNSGKGAALQTGLAAAHGRVVVIQDADLEYDCAQIPALAAPVLNGSADAVFGSRFLQSNPNIYKRYLWGNKILTGFINLLCGSRLTDSYTCYKILKRDLAQSLGLVSRGFEIEAELTVKLLLSGARLIERPISYRPRSLEQGKKIGWKDGAKGLLTSFRARFRLL